jgi:hypothetical protein
MTENLLNTKTFLEAVLVSSMTEDNHRLPTIAEFILGELVNGIMTYIGEKEPKMSYLNFKGTYGFENKIFAYIVDKSQLIGEKLDPKIKKIIDEITFVRIVHPYPDDAYPVCSLYNIFKGRICHVFNKSTFSLPYDAVIRTRKETIPSLSETERKDVIEIGQAMRPFIEQDLEYIKKNYRW